MNVAIDLADLVAIALFIYGLHELNSPATARRGNRFAMVGMVIALVGILVRTQGVGWPAVAIGVAIGGIVGIYAALKVKMTAMPQMVALYNGAGGGAAALDLDRPVLRSRTMRRASTTSSPSRSCSRRSSARSASAGSIVAFLKLQEVMTGRPITYPGQQVVNALVLLAIARAGGRGSSSRSARCRRGDSSRCSRARCCSACSSSCRSAAPTCRSSSRCSTRSPASPSRSPASRSTRTLLIICGALVGASGTILTVAMSRAMNRPLTNVLFGAFGAAGGTEVAAGSGGPQQIRSASADDVAVMLAYACKVIFVPGYGMAVAQAQHSVKALADQLEKRGVKVLYAIHPVAGRMPGHMNVLLAEANVPYNQLLDMEDVNPEFPTADVALVIGANDVTNPAARNVASSPIYGMPILDVDKAANVVVLKRSMRSGFAGIENPLYELPNTSMLFGDAKASVDALTAAVKAL